MSTVDPYRTALPCHPPCDARRAAVLEETFLPSKTLGGWVWLDVPLRFMSWQVRYRHEGAPDHTGEPIVFVDCPWCGGSLPPARDDDWAQDTDDGC